MRVVFRRVGITHLTRHLIPEQPPCASWTDSPRLHILGIAPDKVAEGALMGNLLCSGHDADLVQCADLGAQASMDTQYLAVDDRGQSKKVEDLAAGLPDRCIAVFLLALFVESVDLSDLPGLVIATDECDFVGESGKDISIQSTSRVESH